MKVKADESDSDGEGAERNDAESVEVRDICYKLESLAVLKNRACMFKFPSYFLCGFNLRNQKTGDIFTLNWCLLILVFHPPGLPGQGNSLA